MLLINQIYDIDVDTLKPYQVELRFLITEMDDFIQNYKLDTPIQFSRDSKQKILGFQSQHNHIFNKLIVQINDAE